MKHVGKRNFGNIFLVLIMNKKEIFASKILQEWKNLDNFNSYINENQIAMEPSFGSINLTHNLPSN